jgi:hypothetical protein
MNQAYRQFLVERFKEIRREDGSFPYADGNIFTGQMPRDFLKDNDYVANCLVLQDRKKKDGSLISNVRNEACTHYVQTRRRFRRTLLVRCFLYAPTFDELWSNGSFKGFVEQIEQRIAEHRVIADSMNNCIDIDLHDVVRPWNEDESEKRRRRQPHKGIVRIEFLGGIYTTKDIPIVQDVDIKPSYQ